MWSNYFHFNPPSNLLGTVSKEDRNKIAVFPEISLNLFRLHKGKVLDCKWEFVIYFVLGGGYDRWFVKVWHLTSMFFFLMLSVKHFLPFSNSNSTRSHPLVSSLPPNLSRIAKYAIQTQVYLQTLYGVEEISIMFTLCFSTCGMKAKAGVPCMYMRTWHGHSRVARREKESRWSCTGYRFYFPSHFMRKH